MQVNTQGQDSQAVSELASTERPFLSSKDEMSLDVDKQAYQEKSEDIAKDTDNNRQNDAIKTPSFDEACEPVDHQAKEAASINANALALGINQQVCLLKQQEQQKLATMLADLKKKTAMISTAVSDEGQDKLNANKMTLDVQGLDELRLQGALLAPLAGMQKIKAVHNKGLAHLLAEIHNALPLDEVDKGDAS